MSDGDDTFERGKEYKVVLGESLKAGSHGGIEYHTWTTQFRPVSIDPTGLGRVEITNDEQSSTLAVALPNKSGEDAIVFTGKPTEQHRDYVLIFDEDIQAFRLERVAMHAPLRLDRSTQIKIPVAAKTANGKVARKPVNSSKQARSQSDDGAADDDLFGAVSDEDETAKQNGADQSDANSSDGQESDSSDGLGSLSDTDHEGADHNSPRVQRKRAMYAGRRALGRSESSTKGEDGVGDGIEPSAQRARTESNVARPADTAGGFSDDDMGLDLSEEDL